MKVDSQTHLKELSPLKLTSCDRVLPAATQNRSRSPSPVAVVKPMFQIPKPQTPYRQQASIGPVMVGACPVRQPVSPPLPHAHYSNQLPQQRLENVMVIDDPQIVGTQDGERDDRPFDPNLVCPKCKQQFRIGEIQAYKKHYKLYHTMDKKEDSDPVGYNVCINKIAYI